LHTECWHSESILGLIPYKIVQVFIPLTAEELARKGVHTAQPLPIESYRTVEKGHGPIEERQIRVLGCARLPGR
jgi:hypothetical protein